MTDHCQPQDEASMQRLRQASPGVQAHPRAVAVRGPSVSGEFPTTTSFSGELSPTTSFRIGPLPATIFSGSSSPFTTGSSGCGWLHRPLPDARALNQRARNVALQYARLKPYTV
ncbi:hypothetical protein PF011_g8884 [Phytophthora fragariae]|uniref:Uncharacterized protein n=1 Tax=Phytophthora fragariae TaxID=53985 RepID=A0A6A3L0G1_9STRA|nr:hypothetical protein PF011_g8884 [Phytophthora fragariae]